MDRVVVERISKAFGRQRALAGVSLELRPGSLCAVLGPNGAGKSTLVGVLSTLVRPSAGQVRYQLDGAVLDARSVRAAIGLLAHESLLYSELSAVENLVFYAALYDLPDARARAERLLEEVGLERDARERPVRTYSRGMLQRAALARALLGSPALVLLDEPFTGLDVGGAEALVRSLAELKDEGRMLLVVTHDLEAVAELADHVVVLRGGRVALDESQDGPFGRAGLAERYAQALATRSQRVG